MAIDEHFDSEKWLRDHHALIKTARSLYESEKEIRCPFFAGPVALTSDGFNHLLNKPNREPRNIREQNRKLRLLKKALQIIKASGTVQEYRNILEKVGKPAKDGLTKTAIVEYWAFHDIIGYPGNMFLVRAVVRKVGEGKRHFWSAMAVGKVGKNNKIHKEGIDTD